MDDPRLEVVRPIEPLAHEAYVGSMRDHYAAKLARLERAHAEAVSQVDDGLIGVSPPEYTLAGLRVIILDWRIGRAKARIERLGVSPNDRLGVQ